MADYIVTTTRSVLPVPDDIDFDHASSFFVNPLTAIGMVERVKELKSRSCIVTAAASQIGRMIIQLLASEGIIPICTVRKEDQAEMLRKVLGPKLGKFVVNTSSPTFKKELGMICMKLKPSTCLECVSGDVTGTILEFMGYKSTLILYGILSDKPAGNINTISFIGKAQTIEGFILNQYLATKSLSQFFEIFLKAESMYKTALKTTVNKRFGFHQVEEAVEYYLKNQTAGKIVFKPSLTTADAEPTQPLNLD